MSLSQNCRYVPCMYKDNFYYTIENCTFIHCNIHREALVVNRMPEKFKLVLQEAIKVANFIKSRLFS